MLIKIAADGGYAQNIGLFSLIVGFQNEGTAELIHAVI